MLTRACLVKRRMNITFCLKLYFSMNMEAAQRSLKALNPTACADTNFPYDSVMLHVYEWSFIK